MWLFGVVSMDCVQAEYSCNFVNCTAECIANDEYNTEYMILVLIHVHTYTHTQKERFMIFILSYVVK